MKLALIVVKHPKVLKWEASMETLRAAGKGLNLLLGATNGINSDGAMERRATLRGKTERRRLNVEQRERRKTERRTARTWMFSNGFRPNLT